MTTTVTPTRLPGLHAAVARVIDRLRDLPLPARPAPIAGAIALLAACAAGVLVALGPVPDELSAITVVPTLAPSPASAG